MGKRSYCLFLSEILRFLAIPALQSYQYHSCNWTVPMFMSVTCPTCGHKCRVPESALGQRVKCPACSNQFQCGSLSPPSLATTPLPDKTPPPVQAASQAKTVQVQPDQHIHYRCPRCTKSLESPIQMVGQKVNCPDCGQRLQIPESSDS